MKQKGKLRWLWLSFLVIIVDQYTKHLAMCHLSSFKIYPFIPHVNFRLAFNYGAAFSFLSFASGWQHWLFICFASVICLVILIWLGKLKSNQYSLAIALSLIFGGALGNVIDRVRYGYVVDFIDFYVKNWHWPTFNFADSMICIGVAILFFDLLFKPKNNT